jgi:hypothetical protein
VEDHRVVRLRGFHIFWTIGSQMAVRLSALRACRPLPPGWFLALISVRGWVDPRGHSAAGRIRSVEKSNYLIGNRLRDLPACSIKRERTVLNGTEPHYVTSLQRANSEWCLLRQTAPQTKAVCFLFVNWLANSLRSSFNLYISSHISLLHTFTSLLLLFSFSI